MKKAPDCPTQSFETRTSRSQIFKTEDQWNSGLFYRLKKLQGGGITLFSRPAFTEWILTADDRINPISLCVDDCGRIYWIDGKRCQLYRYDPGNKLYEHIPSVSGCGSEPGEVKNPARMLMDRHTMWLLDRGTDRVLAFSIESFQIKYIIASHGRLVDDLRIRGCDNLF